MLVECKYIFLLYRFPNLESYAIRTVVVNKKQVTSKKKSKTNVWGDTWIVECHSYGENTEHNLSIFVNPFCKINDYGKQNQFQFVFFVILFEARREDARQRVSQRVQHETEAETEPIIFYLYSIKF